MSRRWIAGLVLAAAVAVAPAKAFFTTIYVKTILLEPSGACSQVAFPASFVYVALDTGKSCICQGGTWVCENYGAGAGGAPTGSAYITKTADGTLSNEFALSSLATALLVNTTTTGVPTAYAGTACGANNWFSGLSAVGAPTCTQPAFSNISGTLLDAQVPDTITVDLAAVATLANSVSDTGLADIDALNRCGGVNGKVLKTSGGVFTCQDDAVGAGGSGIATLNGLTTDPQSFVAVDDANIDLLIGSAGSTHTFSLAWSGDLPYSRLAQPASPISVLGVAGGSIADVAPIVAGSEQQVLRRSGATLAFGALDVSNANALTGNLPVARLNGGTGATSSTFWRGDGVWGTPAGGGNMTNTGASAVGQFPRYTSTSGTAIAPGATVEDASGNVAVAGYLTTEDPGPNARADTFLDNPASIPDPGVAGQVNIGFVAGQLAYRTNGGAVQTIAPVSSKHAECFTLYDPDGLVDTNDIPSVWRAPAAVTVTEVWAETDAGTPSVNLQRDDGTPANVLSANLTATTGGATGSLAAAEDNFADGDRLDFVMVTASTSDRMTVCVEYTYD